MPNPNFYGNYFAGTGEASSDIWVTVDAAQIRQQYEEWQQDCERQAEEKRQEQEDRMKYPLFFWRENTK